MCEQFIKSYNIEKGVVIMNDNDMNERILRRIEEAKKEQKKVRSIHL